MLVANCMQCQLQTPGPTCGNQGAVHSLIAAAGAIGHLSLPLPPLFHPRLSLQTTAPAPLRAVLAKHSSALCAAGHLLDRRIKASLARTANLMHQATCVLRLLRLKA